MPFRSTISSTGYRATPCRVILAFLAPAVIVTAFGSSASGAIVTWTDWTSATIGVPGSAAGSLNTGTGSPVNVTYSGEVNGQTQTNGGTNYWRSDPAYISSTVENGPGQSGPGYTGSTDIVALSGQSASPITNTISFSAPVTDPILAILSLGRPNVAVTYTFDSDFSILSSGAGWFGGAATGSLFRDGVGQLRGVEGHGVIVFSGTFTSISFTAAPSEFWHGFQVGVVPSPSATAFLGLGGVMVTRRRR